MELKKKEITDRVKEFVERYGSKPELFGKIRQGRKIKGRDSGVIRRSFLE